MTKDIKAWVGRIPRPHLAGKEYTGQPHNNPQNIGIIGQSPQLHRLAMHTSQASHVLTNHDKRRNGSKANDGPVFFSVWKTISMHDVHPRRCTLQTSGRNHATSNVSTSWNHHDRWRSMHPYGIMWNSELALNWLSQWCRTATLYDHPSQGGDYHQTGWCYVDISLLSKLGSITPSISTSSLIHFSRPPLIPSAICLIFCHRAMETRTAGKRSSLHPPVDPPGRRPSKDLKRAAETARAFKQCLPSDVQHDVEAAETRVWQKVEEAKYDGELDEHKQWVKDPGYTNGRLALYDRALAYYWAAKHLCGLLLTNNSAKEKEEHEPTKMWRPHYRETHMIHMKIDAIANKIGIPFLPKDSAANLMQGENQPKESGGTTPEVKDA